MPGLFKRVGDIVNASLNDVLDRVEDPERMLKQMVREMEDNVTTAKARVVDAVTTEKQLHRQLERHREQQREWLAKAEAAVKSGDEVSARAALERKAEHESIAAALTPQWEATSASCTTLKQQLDALQNKLAEAKRQQSGLLARQKAAQARTKIEETATELTSTLGPQATLARVEDKVLGLEARAEALAEVVQVDATSDPQTASAAKVEAELEGLKRKIAQS